MANKVKKNIRAYAYKRNGKLVKVPTHKRTYMVRKNRGAVFGIDQFSSGSTGTAVIHAGQQRDAAARSVADTIAGIELSSKLAAKREAAEEKRRDDLVDLAIKYKRGEAERKNRAQAEITKKDISEAEKQFARYKREQTMKPFVDFGKGVASKGWTGAKIIGEKGVELVKKVKIPKTHKKYNEFVDAENDLAKTKFFTLEQLNKRERLKNILEKVGFHKKEPSPAELRAELEKAGFKQPPDIDFKQRKHDVSQLLEEAGFGGFNTKDIIKEIKLENVSVKPKKKRTKSTKAEQALANEEIDTFVEKSIQKNIDDVIKDSFKPKKETKKTRKARDDLSKQLDEVIEAGKKYGKGKKK